MSGDPLSAEARNDTLALALPGWADGNAGVAGDPTITDWVTAFGLDPTAFTAWIRNEYVWPLVNPVTVSWVADGVLKVCDGCAVDPITGVTTYPVIGDALA